MNILVLNYEFPPLGGGAAPVCKELSIRLSQRGHNITVVTMGFENLPAYEEIQGVKIYRLACLRKKKNVCKPWEQYSYLLAVRRFMKQHMMNHQYDVCHVHFVIPTGEAACWVEAKYHIPYIITAHGSDVEGHNKKPTMKLMHRVLRSSWRKIVRKSHAVVSPSMYLMDLMNHNYFCNKYTYIPNGIEWNKWYALAKAEYKENRILIMGRLQKFKNVQIILKALAQVNLKDWEVDILGDGPYKEGLKEIAEKSGLADKVQFHGWIDNGTKEHLLFVKKAKIYISASQFENCPMSVLETTAAGCYPLLSDIPAHRQLIADDRYFFELDNIQGLTQKIQRLITDKRQDVENIADISRFDWNVIVEQYENILKCAYEERI